jgi:hypothetical protein
MTKINFFTFLAATIFSFSALAQNYVLKPAVVENANATEGYKITADKVDPTRFNNIAVVQVLNKTTAKTSILELKIGEKTHFGTIFITALRCWQAPLDQKPESKILLEVFEEKNANNDLNFEVKNEKKENTEKKEVRIFYGWIFASSPSISGLESPIYDLTAIGCKNK